MLRKKAFEILHQPIHILQTFNAYYSMSFSTPFYPRLEISEQPQEEEKSNDEEDKQNNRDEEQRNGRTNWRLPASAFSLPFLYIANEKLDKRAECFIRLNGDKLEQNKLKNRVGITQYAANKPIEDRYHCKQLENLDGYVVSVFDGHGGWQVAELAMNHLSDDLDELIKANRSKYSDEDQLITESLKQAFDKVEKRFLEIARESYQVGFPYVARVGSCALVAVVHNKKLYVANAGDCKGVLCTKGSNGEVSLTKINQKFNANSKKEQKRLKAEFKDPDIFVCRRSGACYVKNVLQVTRALGDFELKYPEFNNPRNLGMDRGYTLQIEEFSGPYISHIPDVKIFNLKPEDKYIVLASDGMWDELKKDQVAKVVKTNIGDKSNISSNLLKEALGVVGKRTNMSQSDLSRIPFDKRRNVHDDMTILVVDIQNQ